MNSFEEETIIFPSDGNFLIEIAIDVTLFHVERLMKFENHLFFFCKNHLTERKYLILYLKTKLKILFGNQLLESD